MFECCNLSKLCGSTTVPRRVRSERSSERRPRNDAPEPRNNLIPPSLRPPSPDPSHIFKQSVPLLPRHPGHALTPDPTRPVSAPTYPLTSLPALANHAHSTECSHASASASGPSEMQTISLNQHTASPQQSEQEYDREAAYAKHLRGGCIDLSSCQSQLSDPRHSLRACASAHGERHLGGRLLTGRSFLALTLQAGSLASSAAFRARSPERRAVRRARGGGSGTETGRRGSVAGAAPASAAWLAGGQGFVLPIRIYTQHVVFSTGLS